MDEMQAENVVLVVPNHILYLIRKTDGTESGPLHVL